MDMCVKISNKIHNLWFYQDSRLKHGACVAHERVPPEPPKLHH